MLNPSYLNHVPDRLVALYAEVEADIIADMARRLSKMDFIPSAEWQYKKLVEMGAVHEEILKKLSAVTGLRKREIERLMKKAGVETLKTDMKIYKAAGLTPSPLDASPALQAVLRAGIDATNGLFDNLTRTTANTATSQFEHALDRAWLQISTGAFDYNSTIRMAVKDLADKGIASITYPSGHKDYLDVAVRRAVVTGVNQTSLKLQDKLAGDMGCDLVETSAHAGARPSHAVWQGKIFSRSGTHPKYPDFCQSTGYGTGEGLGGWNCRHSFFPYFEGMEPVYTQAELDEMRAPKYEYNGRKLTEYEATQAQRGIERKLRKWKREYLGMKAAGLPTDEAAAKLNQWRRTMDDFLEQTGLKQQSEREEVIGFDRSEAAKARGESLKRPLPKTIKAPDTVLQQTLGDPRIKGIIPKDTVIEKVRVIAGAGTSTVFKNAQELAKVYGGEPLLWQKKGGIIYGKYYRYDVHWDELNGRQYNTKLKGVKGR